MSCRFFGVLIWILVMFGFLDFFWISPFGRVPLFICGFWPVFLEKGNGVGKPLLRESFFGESLACVRKVATFGCALVGLAAPHVGHDCPAVSLEPYSSPLPSTYLALTGDEKSAYAVTQGGWSSHVRHTRRIQNPASSPLRLAPLCPTRTGEGRIWKLLAYRLRFCRIFSARLQGVAGGLASLPLSVSLPGCPKAA